MAASFHYIVKIKLFNYLNKDKIELIEHQKEFFDDSPILSRIEAFNFYQSWLDILLESIQSDYSTDRQARKDLKKYLTPNTDLSLKIENNQIDTSSSMSIGIGVYFVIDKPLPAIWKDDKLNDHAGDEDLIHGIGNSGDFKDPANFAFYLENEFDYYVNGGYDYQNLKRTANYFYYQTQEIQEFEFLDTPFDWSGLEDPSHPLLGLVETDANDVDFIIEEGEGECVEFKPTLSYHFKNNTWQGKYEVNYIISRTICSFLNSKGGLLFIGLDDLGIPNGLEFDFSLTKKNNKKDFFKNEFDRVIDEFIGFSYKPLINPYFSEYKGELIFVVKVEPSKHKPVFLSLKKPDATVKEFWIRGTTSTRLLTDIEDIINHWMNRN